MNTANSPESGPVEVWLSQKNMRVNCMIVREDESTDELDINSLSMRGAQREITGYLIRQGMSPAGRWEQTHDDADLEGNGVETVRRFTVAKR